MLERLEFEDLLAELFSLECVGYRGVEGALGDADHLRPDAHATLVQESRGVLVSLAELTQDVAFRHAHVLEVHHACA